MDIQTHTPDEIIHPGNVSGIILHPGWPKIQAVLCVQSLVHQDRRWGLLGGGIKEGETLPSTSKRVC